MIRVNYIKIPKVAMWLKQMFKKQKGPPVPYPEVPPQNLIQSSKFEIESEEDQYTSPLIDTTPDTRYKQYQTIPHEKIMKFPLTILHESEDVFVYEPGMFQSSFLNDYSWQKVDILLSDKQLAISPNILAPLAKSGLNFSSIKYGLIEKCEVVSLKNKKQQMRIKITLKDNRQFYIKGVLGDYIVKLNEIIHKFAFPQGINKFYAFKYGQVYRKLEEENRGWSIYDIKKQFQRQGLITIEEEGNLLPLKYVSNVNGVISPTYPEYLVIPSAMSDQELKKCSNFRTKERFPALTYHIEYEPGKFSLLFRCSQNKVGVMGSRSKEDENMIKYIGQATNIGKQKNNAIYNCKIYDARGYYAALGNMFAGKGYEKPQFYQNCQIEWLNIPNIHAVRDSYNKMISLNRNESFYQLVAQSCWYDYLFLIIAGAKAIAIDLLNGINVVVHCSDGWDRTSQLSALAQLILDPYYRTIQGFAVLVEKDWRHFGHKFRERTGQYRPVNYHVYEKSPIFIQFLDCIRQIAIQFPLSFQFNDRFLLLLAENANSNIYGSFMTNNIQQANQVKITQKTISIWSHVRENLQIYKNPHYRNDLSQIWLNAPTEAKFINVWNELFLGDEGSGRIEYHMMRQFVEINKTLKNEYFANEKLIKELEKELATV